MNDDDIKKLQEELDTDPAALREVRRRMEKDPHLLAAAQMAALEYVLIRAKLCTRAELRQFAEDAKPLLLNVAVAVFEDDAALALASEQYDLWLTAGTPEN